MAVGNMKWWVGQDGNIWANIQGVGVKNMGNASTAMVGVNAGMGPLRREDQIADPNPGNPSQQVAANNNIVANDPGDGGAAAAAAAQRAAALASARSTNEMLRRNIEGLQGVYDGAVGRAWREWENAEARRVEGFNKNKAANEGGMDDNESAILRAQNAIDKNARISNRKAQSILGALGMQGSANIQASRNIANKSNAQIGSENATYGQNKRGLLQAWNDFVTEDNRERIGLTDKRASDVAQAGITRDKAKLEYLSQMANNLNNAGDTAGASAFYNQIGDTNASIAALNQIKPTSMPVAAAYNAPLVSELGSNIPQFGLSVTPQEGNVPTTPKLIKVNEQTGTGSDYGIKRS